MWKLSKSLIWVSVSTLVLLIASEGQGATLRSWSGSLQTGGDLFVGLNGPDGYAGAKAAAVGHNVMPGTAQLSDDQMQGVDVFLWGAVTNELTLSEEETKALVSFVQTGGVLLLESDSGGNDRSSANNALEALGLGRPISEVALPRGNAGSTTGTFTQADSAWLNGPAGDLRGQSFGSTQASFISASEVERLGGAILGGIAELDGDEVVFETAFMAEFKPFSSGGSVIFLGDPYLSNRFTQPSGPYHNPTNASAFQNLLASVDGRGLTGCDLNGDAACDAADIDLLSSNVRQGDHPASFDLNGDRLVNEADRVVWVKDLKNTWFGDSNLDHEFNSADLVSVFAVGNYETNQTAGWGEGDWDGDLIFGSGDLVVAFSDGGYEQGPPAATAVPEPTATILMFSGGLVALMGQLRRNRSQGENERRKNNPNGLHRRSRRAGASQCR